MVLRGQKYNYLSYSATSHGVIFPHLAFMAHFDTLSVQDKKRPSDCGIRELVVHLREN